jgi:hypothetical protein
VYEFDVGLRGNDGSGIPGITSHLNAEVRMMNAEL